MNMSFKPGAERPETPSFIDMKGVGEAIAAADMSSLVTLQALFAQVADVALYAVGQPFVRENEDLHALIAGFHQQAWEARTAIAQEAGERQPENDADRLNQIRIVARVAADTIDSAGEFLDVAQSLFKDLKL